PRHPPPVIFGSSLFIAPNLTLGKAAEGQNSGTEGFYACSMRLPGWEGSTSCRVRLVATVVRGWGGWRCPGCADAVEFGDAEILPAVPFVW
ncbi:hypothetical protein ASPCADRAFT_207677, partial [Aspergillus carbonarius ITEM 5010]